MLYAEFFGLDERPFTLVPDPDFLYWSEGHKNAYAALEYGVLSYAPITLLTGEIGAGKTTLVEHLMRQADEDVLFGLVSNAQGGRGDLITWVLSAFSQPVDPGTPYVELHRAFEAFLLAEYTAGRRAVVIVDEAQNLSPEGLEEIRLLTNINSGKDVLVQLVLVGQPELRDMIAAPNMRQIAQRIAAAYHLRRMDAGAVAAYVAHRMTHAGGTGEEFTPAACAAIHAATEGVPRLVNQMADMALVYAWQAETRRIDADTIHEAARSGAFFWHEIAEASKGAAPEAPPPPGIDANAAGTGQGAAPAKGAAPDGAPPRREAGALRLRPVRDDWAEED